MKPSLQKIYIDKTQSVEDALEWFNNNLGVREEQKDKNGEVFTPHSLIKEMLDQFPKSVWKNKDLKWLDPAAGYGQFMFEVVRRLMDGLKDEIKQPKQRLKHILSKQIYQVEFNPISATVIRGIFKFDGVSSNVFTGSFVPGDYKQVFEKFEDGTNTFDCIIGNPPYQDKKTGTAQGGHDLYIDFVSQLFNRNIINKGGYIAYVHPQKWRSPSKPDIWEMFQSKSLCNLVMRNDKQADIYFPQAKTGGVDYYLLQNKDRSVGFKTTIKMVNNKILKLDISKLLYYLPSGSVELWNKINDASNTYDYIYSRSQYGNDKDWLIKTGKSAKIYCMNTIKDCEYPLLHTYNEKDCVGGWKFYCSKENRDDGRKAMFGVRKIILTLSGYMRAWNDSEGKYGITNLSLGIKYDKKEDGDKIMNAIETSIFKELIENIKWGGGKITNHLAFKNFKNNWYEIVLEEQKKIDEKKQVASSGESTKSASGGKRRKSHRRRSRSKRRKSVSKRQRRMYSKKRSKMT